MYAQFRFLLFWPLLLKALNHARATHIRMAFSNLLLPTMFNDRRHLNKLPVCPFFLDILDK